MGDLKSIVDQGRKSATVLACEGVVLKAIVYGTTNPVKDGLVRVVREGGSSGSDFSRAAFACLMGDVTHHAALKLSLFFVLMLGGCERHEMTPESGSGGDAGTSGGNSGAGGADPSDAGAADTADGVDANDVALAPDGAVDAGSTDATTVECLAEGCPCEPQLGLPCAPEPIPHPEGVLVCREGTRFCRDGFWSECVPIGDYILIRNP